MNNLDIITFKTMVQNGANNLSNARELVNSLNVFPVPDGDTGTNMSLTFVNGNKNVQTENVNNLGELTKSLSKGLLMGARGNSGVILSQIFRGFAQGLEGITEASTLEVAQAFVRGSEVAYKAVMKPVEGTILTVIREGSQAAFDYITENPEIDLVEYFEVFVNESNKSLDHTPELLPVLKEVGVVDSGGKGLVLILEGFLAALKGELIEAGQVEHVTASNAYEGDHDEFGYCTEFILRLDADGNAKYDEQKMKQALGKLGNSIVLVQDDDLVKVHVHTLTPGKALNMAQQYGEFVKLKIENMQEQHSEIVANKENEKSKERKPYALVAVAAGEGLVDYFKDLRVDVVISGGQTMNPSTEDFIEKIKDLNADNIIILPNNSNIILAAQQVKDVLEDQNIHIVPTKTIIQGISACINFNPDDSIDNNINNMTSVIDYVKTGEITYAIKDTQFKGIDIHEGDFMGIADGDIKVNEKDLLDASKKLVDVLVSEDDELLTLLIGEDAPKDVKEALVAYVEENYDLEVEEIESLQPIYSFVIGVE